MASSSSSSSSSSFLLSLPPSLLLLLFLSLLLLLLPLSSLPPVSPQGYTRSNVNRAPVVLNQVSFNKVSKVDGVEQLFNADFYMQSIWFDLALQDVWANYSIYQGGVLPFTDSTGNFDFAPMYNGWWDPQLEFINAAGQPDETGTYYIVTTPDFVTDDVLISLNMTAYTSTGSVGRNGLYWIVKDYRYICDFTTPLFLEDFPFDSQTVQVAIESKNMDVNGLQLYYSVPPSQYDGLKVNEDTDKIIGWTVKAPVVIHTEHSYTLGIAGTYSRLVVGMQVAREPKYYVSKIIVGCVLLVLMCIWVFSLAVDEADRMMGTLTVFGGLITYLFVMSSDVPHIPYQTRLDRFMTFSFFFVFVIMFIHGGLYYFREEEGEGEGERERSVIEMNKVAPASPFGPSSPSATAAAVSFSALTAHSIHSRSNNWIVRWWQGLAFTRKFDVVWIPVLTVTYVVGVAVILGPPPGPLVSIYGPDEMLPTLYG